MRCSFIKENPIVCYTIQTLCFLAFCNKKININIGNSGIIRIDPNNGTSYNWPDTGSVKILSDRPNNVRVFEQSEEVICVYNGSASPQNVNFSYNPGSDFIVNVPAGEFYRVSFPSTAPSSGECHVDFAGNDPFTSSYAPRCNYPVYNFNFINKYGMWDNFSINLLNDSSVCIIW